MIKITAGAVALAMAGMVAADGVVAMGPGGGGDTCDTATVIPSLPFSDVGNTCGYDDDYDETCPLNAPGSPDVVYRYTPPEDQVVTISLCTDSDYDTKIYVYSGVCPEYQSGDYRRCNEDACSTPSFSSPYVSRIEDMGLNGGTTYYIVIDGYGGGCGTYTLDIETLPQPTCEAASIFGRDPMTAGWTLSLSDAASGYLRYDAFSGLSEPICGATWYGVMTNWVPGEGFAECEEDPVVFTVSFYSDAGGEPGALVATRTAALSGEPMNVFYVMSSNTPMVGQRWAMNFPCVALSDGWISIQASGGDEECEFYWVSSHYDGDGHLSWNGFELEHRFWDLSFCLLGDDSCGDDAAGNCYITNGSPACDDIQCCLTVCAVDPFCCDIVWDGNCGFQAGQLCGNCGDVEAGSCLADNGTPGCDDGGCCQTVCILDDFCCNVEWDNLCAQEALENCSGPCCLPDGSCEDGITAGDCVAMGGVFRLAGTLCSDTICPFPQCPGSGNCYENNGSPGCATESCCNLVCNLDSFCCDTFWDQLCAEQAVESCGCSCDHDFDSDVDVDDLLVILGSWGTSVGDCTGDGVTDVDDLLGVLGQWGGCE